MKSKEETVEEVFQLPNEVVTVKFLPRKKGLAAHVDDNHVISGGMLSGSKIKYCAPIDRHGGIMNVLTKAEKTFLEYNTELKLSVYGDFWKTFWVHLYKDNAMNVFDLSVPIDYISIKVLESWKDEIAPSWKSRNDISTYKFAITRADEEFAEGKAKLDVKKNAFKMYGKIEDDREKLIGVLKLLTNQPISTDSKLMWLQGKVEEHLDAKPKSFLDIIQDPTFDTKVLINKCVDAGIIKRNGNKYGTVDGLELCEAGGLASFDNAVKYLENPKNQEVKSLLEARIDNTK